MFADLATLTPSVIVCVGFLIGVYALLRREMAPRRRSREHEGSAADMSTGAGISDGQDVQRASSTDDEEAADQPSGRRSLG
ncbi:MAG TPA: hypothetical protein VGL63_15640 [Streptosporangiaceae bacterium]|jgi:hypothetical protein